MTQTPEIETSEELARRFQRGDESAFDVLVEAWDRPLIELAFRLLGNRADAEDARQSTWVKAYLNLAGYEGRARFDTWLFRIAVYECRDRARRRMHEARQRMQLVEPDDLIGPAPGPVEESLERESRERVALAVLALPEEERECVVLRHYHELPTTEIALLLEIPRTTVHSRLARALTRLSRQLRWYRTSAVEKEKS